MRSTGGPADSTPLTDFERSSHAELCGMLVGSSPGDVLAVGDTLTRAGAQIQSLADDLAGQLAGLQWSGPAAEAFTGWARQLISATDGLAAYAGHTGAAVTLAGAQLSATRAAMPPVPAQALATVAEFQRQQQRPPATPGITDQQALRAQSTIQAAYQEALHQMERLATTYLTAAATLPTTPLPTFPPLPSTLMPPTGSGRIDSSENYWPVEAGASASAPFHGRGGTAEGRAATGEPASSGASHLGPVRAVSTPAQPPSTTGHSTAASTTLQGLHPHALLTSPVSPLQGNGGSPNGSGVIGALPPLTWNDGARGGTDGFDLPGRSGSTAATPGAGMAEEGAGRFVPAAMSGHQYAGSIGPSFPVAEGSVVGSLPVAHPVVGGEAATAGPFAGGAEGRTSRDMAPGGIGAFDMGPGAAGRRRGRRAGYLVEDEETWTSVIPGTNPAVIE